MRIGLCKLSSDTNSKKENVMNVKQVIVMRTQYPDGKGGTTGIRKGKLIAQGSHASMAFMSHYLRQILHDREMPIFKRLVKKLFHRECPMPEISQAVKDWINGSFAKVVLQADDEQTLLDIQKACEEAGVMCHLITDSGFTEFHGVPTNTAIAIGPDYSDKIDALTGPQGRFPLKLY